MINPSVPFVLLVCLLSWLCSNSSSCLADASLNQAASSASELLQNPNLVTADGKALAASWKPWQPEWGPAALLLKPSPEGVRFSGSKQPYGVGGLAQTIDRIRGGQAYAVSAVCELPGVPHPYGAAVVRVEWQKERRSLHPAGVLARGPRIQGTQGLFQDVLIAPAEATGARLILESKWPQDGAILWKSASLRPTDTPLPRKVKVGTVYLRPRNSTPQRNMDLWCEQIDAAGKLGLDIVGLSEAILLVGTTSTASGVAETIPGPATERLGAAANRNKIWVVAGLMEIDGDRLFNSAVLFDRQGRVAGKYRKIHLPREEWQKGIMPGSDYPVFQTDFGTVAIQICYDYFFSEPTQILAQRGAEIVFAPTWGTTFPDTEGRVEGQSIFRVRARDNGIFLVPSVYDGDSMVIDPMGRILASNKGQTGVFWSEIDLNNREPLWWVGEWRSIGPRDRMPSTYQPLLHYPE